MEIWWINHHARLPIVPGGTRHYNLAKELKKLGHNTTIINGTFDHLGPMLPFKEKKHIHNPIKTKYNGVLFYSIPTPKYKGSSSLGRVWSMIIFMLKTISKLKNTPTLKRPDVIIGSTVHPLAALAGLILAKIHKVPFIYEVRDLWPLTLVELGKIPSRHPIVIFFSLLDKVLSKSSSTIITTAPLMKTYYKSKFHLPEGKFLWITNGSDLVFSQKNTLNKNISSPIKIGYSGSLGEANGVLELMKGLKKTPKEIVRSFQFHIIGDGPQKEEIKRLAAKLNLNMVFHNPVPKKILSEKLSNFDVLLVMLQPSPIYRYGISLNKIADYHKAGKPIAMIGRCAANPLDQSHAGFKVNSLKELPALLRNISKATRSELIKMGEKGRIYGEKNYEWSTLAKKLDIRLVKIAKTNTQITLKKEGEPSRSRLKSPVFDGNIR
ncbi:glycosyltransferase family 4 protein [Dethiosulfovibrio salsuginis]|uniref:Glycosyltransferase involved in cell wall bisynthesis n=1 Tax=Dethiosulfovibrio salsuginis TaxID=561720 RepID=A0A1X7IPN0_9BACT|nr:glycosyltransferase family 4 protein [Dethiosulfovibrio salsuginis]SMG17006.1 Glycosyltransferase involved in cell wall bisynthesis [Dethiosulfovibrio salsuginis]